MKGQPSSFEFFSRFPNEAAARKYFEDARWPNGITCIHCGNTAAWIINDGKLYTCKACREQFTIRTGTVMQDSKLPLQKWLYAMYLMTVSRKGISSIQLAKELGITQKSAWHLAHRIREACKSGRLLAGVIEADETYIGGLERNKHADKKRKDGIHGPVDKSAVIGARSRDGEIRAEVIYGTELKGALNRSVSSGVTIYTDGRPAYPDIPGCQLLPTIPRTLILPCAIMCREWKANALRIRG